MVRILQSTDYSYLSGKAESHFKAALTIALLAFLLLVIPVIGPFLAGVLLLVSVSQMGLWNSYMKGIGGERRVSKALQKLSDEYILLEDIKLYERSGNIDHIVVGPNGVFVLETKNYRGFISCYGDKWYQATKTGVKGIEIGSISQQVKNNARLLYGYLQSHLVGGYLNRLLIEPVIVFTNSSMKLKTKNPTVLVTTHKRVVKSILKTDTGTILTLWEIDQMANAIVAGLQDGKVG